MPRVHTRDHGFNHDLVTEDVAAVITTAAARLVANPEHAALLGRFRPDLW